MYFFSCLKLEWLSFKLFVILILITHLHHVQPPVPIRVVVFSIILVHVFFLQIGAAVAARFVEVAVMLAHMDESNCAKKSQKGNHCQENDETCNNQFGFQIPFLVVNGKDSDNIKLKPTNAEDLILLCFAVISFFLVISDCFSFQWLSVRVLEVKFYADCVI